MYALLEDSNILLYVNVLVHVLAFSIQTIAQEDVSLFVLQVLICMPITTNVLHNALKAGFRITQQEFVLKLVIQA